MFIQVTPLQNQAAPQVAAVFYAANTTLDKALIYDVSVVTPDSASEHKHARRRVHAIKKGNYYTGAVNPTEKTTPAALLKTAAHR